MGGAGRVGARARAVLLAAACALAPCAEAQTVLELRGASNQYRFVDLSHAFPGGPLVDLLYTGVPGMNELYAGLGWQWKPARTATITPIVYAVAGKENGERGAAVGALVSVGAGRLKLAGFGAHFFRISGEVPAYDFADSLDLTLAAGSYELGASLNFFRQGGSFTYLLGPTVKRNDARGAWALSVRGGDGRELRLVRVVTF